MQTQLIIYNNTKCSIQHEFTPQHSADLLIDCSQQSSTETGVKSSLKLGIAQGSSVSIAIYTERRFYCRSDNLVLYRIRHCSNFNRFREIQTVGNKAIEVQFNVCVVIRFVQCNFLQIFFKISPFKLQILCFKNRKSCHVKL